MMLRPQRTVTKARTAEPCSLRPFPYNLPILSILSIPVNYRLRPVTRPPRPPPRCCPLPSDCPVVGRPSPLSSWPDCSRVPRTLGLIGCFSRLFAVPRPMLIARPIIRSFGSDPDDVPCNWHASAGVGRGRGALGRQGATVGEHGGTDRASAASGDGAPRASPCHLLPVPHFPVAWVLRQRDMKTYLGIVASSRSGGEQPVVILEEVGNRGKGRGDGESAGRP